MNISHLLGSFSWQSASFPGRAAESRTLFLRVSSRAFLAASRAREAVMHFSMMSLAWAGFSARYSESLSQILRKLVGHGPVHQRPDVGVAQLGLGLALELGLFQLHGDDGGEAFADVVAGEGLIRGLQKVEFPGVVVDHPGQGRLEANQMGAALVGGDVVGIGHDELVVAVVILHGHLHGGGLHLALHAGAGEVQGHGLQQLLVLVEVGDELPDAALIAEAFAVLGLHPLVGEGDP